MVSAIYSTSRSKGRTARSVPGSPSTRSARTARGPRFIGTASSVETPRRPSPHAVFERKLDDACARANLGGHRVAVVRLHVGGPILARTAEDELMNGADASVIP